MDGISNVLGLNTVSLTIGARSLTLTTMTLAEYAEREAYILSLRMDRPALPELSNEKPPKRRVSRDEDCLFQNSPRGLGWRMMRAVRRFHPEFGTLESAMELLDQAGPGDLATIEHKLSQSEERDILQDIYMPGSGRGGDSEGGRFPWASLARNLATKYGWTTATISQLTLYQALMHSGGKCYEDGQFNLDDQEMPDFLAWQARRELAGLA